MFKEPTNKDLSQMIKTMSDSMNKQSISIKDLSQTIKVMSDSMNKQFISIDMRLDGMDKRFDAMDKKIETEIEGLAVMTQNRFDELDNKVGKRFETVEYRLKVIEATLDQIKVDLAELLKKNEISDAEALSLKIRIERAEIEIKDMRVAIAV